MKRFISMLAITILALFVANNCFAEATSVERHGTPNYITQYKISDAGGEFDNVIVYLPFGLLETVIQVSSTDFHTSKENFGCWYDSDITECPDDDIGGGELRSPTLVFLDNIFAAGNNTKGADLSELATKKIYLAFWHEYKMQKLAADSVAEMVLEGMNALQQRRSLKYVYFGNGIDLSTAQSIANNYITNGIMPTYDDYGLATMPQQDRRLLKLFGDSDWFGTDDWE